MVTVMITIDHMPCTDAVDTAAWRPGKDAVEQWGAYSALGFSAGDQCFALEMKPPCPALWPEDPTPRESTCSSPSTLLACRTLDFEQSCRHVAGGRGAPGANAKGERAVGGT